MHVTKFIDKQDILLNINNYKSITRLANQMFSIGFFSSG